MRADQFFDSHDYTEEKKVPVASIEFTEYPLVWWNQLCCTEGQPETWENMRALMRRFVPAYYTRTLHMKL